MKFNHPDISAAILAGGKNSRMNGENKALLNIDDIFIIDRQLEVLSKLFNELFIVWKNFENNHSSVIAPLHAIYRKSIVNITETTLKQEDIRIRNMFNDIKIKYFDVNLHYNTIRKRYFSI
jgi:molybdopterin-guanine dinucleotide biosynthesis protein A